MTAENGPGSSRSDFLKQAAGATIAVAGAGTGAGLLAESAAAAPRRKRNRKYLELDGVNVGELIDASGGEAGFAIVVADVDQDGFPDRTLGGPTRNEFTLVLGSNLDPAAYDWIKEALDNGRKLPRRRGGGIVFTDDRGVEVGHRSFTDAVITSVTMPALSNGLQTLPGIVVTFTAGSVSDDPPSGNRITGKPRQKAWLSLNFRLDIPGLGGHVASVDSFTWTCPPVENGVAPPIDPPILWCSVADDGSWAAWYDKYALGGDQSDVRNGTLKTRPPVHPPPRVQFLWGMRKLRIFTLQPDLDLPPGQRMRAGLCCDSCTWDVLRMP